jgi:short-subunit dehydrogenase
LQAVAEDAKRFGVKAVAIPADVTVAADRERLVREAEAALGQIDILINNAGLEPIGRFVSRSNAEIEATVTTNLTAPALLARAVLPSMLARKRGHIVNLASLAGKLGVPYNAIYASTKAAMFAWSDSLRIELEGTGVSVSVIAPGFVNETGMFSRHYHQPPALLGESQPQAVVNAVLRALQKGENEIIVNPMPFAPMVALYALAPKFLIGMMKQLGIMGFLKKTYDVD